MMKKTMNIVLTGDANYVYPLGVLMVSVMENLNPDYRARFFLFVSDFDDAARTQLNKLHDKYDCDIIYYDMTQYLHLFSAIDVSTFRLGYISLATYYRLLMMKILPDDVDKCFYIDGDMICGGDLSKIYEQNTDNILASVVVEILAMTNRDTTLGHLLEWDEFKPLAENRVPYFNAGFLLINIRRAKELKLFDAAFEFLRAHPNPPYADQDTLNAIIGQKYPDEILFLPPEYNVFCDIDYSRKYNAPTYTRAQIRRAFRHPVIYHYAGGNKPWINSSVRHFYRVWWKYAKKSPWARELFARPRGFNVKSIRLFNAVEIIKIITSADTQKIMLMGFIPLWSRQRMYNITRYKLFNLIPLMKVIHDYHD